MFEPSFHHRFDHDSSAAFTRGDRRISNDGRSLPWIATSRIGPQSSPHSPRHHPPRRASGLPSAIVASASSSALGSDPRDDGHRLSIRARCSTASKGSLARSAAEPPLTPSARRARRPHSCDGRRARWKPREGASAPMTVRPDRRTPRIDSQREVSYHLPHG
jgi:hypothetical protein